ncbi:hypothetical protein [Pseudomonas sp.]|uniref:hypothetical protein n=1 Tax=Pseudomonas sp. TaxID=306 RepID=UPI002618515C|nr:hypothetical protein [Pseudomonas sp.]
MASKSFPQSKIQALKDAACGSVRIFVLRNMKNTKLLKYNDFIRDLKTVDCNRSMSSNPIASAILLHRQSPPFGGLCRFWGVGLLEGILG